MIRTPRRETISGSPVRSTPVSRTDTLSSSWLELFPPDFRQLITGSMSSVTSRTVSTSGSTSSVAQFTSIVSAQSGSKPFLSFDRALSQHLQSGGTGNVFYDPVMHYDLNSMKEKFEAVNEEAGIYKKEGVLYAKKDLGGSDVLQPIGIQKTKEGEYEAVGLSTDLPKEQAQALKNILTALKENNGNLEEALEKVEEAAANETSSAGEEGSAPPAAPNSTH